MDVSNWTPAQWLNLAMFALGSLAVAGWWQDFVTPQHSAAVTGGLVWLSSLLNFVLTGKATPAAPPTV